MCVLIEALSVVVAHGVLDVSFPGGVDGFHEIALKLPHPPRVAVTDSTLTSVSFLDPDHAVELIEKMMECGIVWVDNDTCVEVVLIDQRLGPTMPCAWIEWKRHPDGFTYAWLSGHEPGDMAVPTDWTPDQSRGLEFHDYRDEPGRLLPLAREGEVETWLDFLTGQINRGRVTEPDLHGPTDKYSR